VFVVPVMLKVCAPMGTVAGSVGLDVNVPELLADAVPNSTGVEYRTWVIEVPGARPEAPVGI